MADLDQVPVLAPQVVARQVDDVLVVLLPESGEVKVLNEVGARILELVDGVSTTRQIAARIAAEYEVSEQQAVVDAQLFLRQLQGCQALTFKAAGELPTEGG